MSISFAVDDVAPEGTLPPTCSLREHMGDPLAFAGDGSLRVLAAKGSTIHPLLSAVHVAFAEHRPLVLSPDAVWLTIVHGVAQHVRLHAEQLRDRLVQHEGKRRLEVQIPGGFRAAPEVIESVVRGFRNQIATEIGEGRARLLTCDFSTTGEIERTASEIVLMAVFSPYYTYKLGCICGIPELTLLGEPRDWRAIRERIGVLAELDLTWWAASLAPIADKLVEASDGRPDNAFFRAIYKPKKAYGWDLVTGWIGRLYPYVQKEGRFSERNPLLDLPINWEPPPQKGRLYSGPGIRTQDVPSHSSSCLVRVHDQMTNEHYDVVLEGGLVAVNVDDAGRLSPIAGWAVRKSAASIDAVVEALRERQDVVLAGSVADGQGAHARTRLSLTPEHGAMLDAFSEARLFVGRVEGRIRPPSEYERIDVQGVLPVTRMIDLPDGTFLAYGNGTRGTYVVRLRDSELEDPIADLAPDGSALEHSWRRPSRERMSDVPVVARSLAEAIDGVLRSSGNVELTTLGNMVDELPAWRR